jgi:hypothetical protein
MLPSLADLIVGGIHSSLRNHHLHEFNVQIHSSSLKLLPL